MKCERSGLGGGGKGNRRVVVPGGYQVTAEGRELNQDCDLNRDYPERILGDSAIHRTQYSSNVRTSGLYIRY